MNSKTKMHLVISLLLIVPGLIILLGFMFIDKLGIFLFLILFGGIVFFFSGFQKLHQKRIIANLPLSKIRSLSMGLVKLNGQIMQNEKLLISPINKEKCIYYNCHIEELKKRGRSTSWVTIFRSIASVPFYVQDETGKILVNLKNAEVNINMDSQDKSGFFKKINPNFQEFLTKIGVKYKNFLNIPKSFRYKESFLAPGDQIHIIGTASYGNTPNMEISNGQNMAHADSFKEAVGKLESFNTYPFSTTYKPEVVLLKKENYPATGFRRETDNTVINKGESMFIVSDKGEDMVIKSLSMNSYLSILFGFFMIVGGLMGILIYLRII